MVPLAGDRDKCLSYRSVTQVTPILITVSYFDEGFVEDRWVQGGHIDDPEP